MTPDLKTVFVPIHREGWLFIGLALAIAFLLATASAVLGVLGLVVAGWFTYFFRDPPRVIPTREGLVVSPADGHVFSISESRAPEELDLGEESFTRVSIFLNVFDVHIQRLPVSGEITKVAYHPGKFLNASLDKASEDNERNGLALRMADGQNVAVVQIAGLVARRIVCWVRGGDKLEAGTRYGLIRFGSRVDVYLPKGISPLVCIGQRVLGGETVIADMVSKESARVGSVR
ncbi:MAG TPA: phosphatidylserine decarboxylase family protein [Rhodospirillaceae bacterium]|nr:MAG: phosphatidylserine decarboxylase [Alphaproteobacteria bacterium GWF2_58_20]HAU29519.1 phosphatidylserine decarboxylase family protein [Rhodospirillaceae bacterium]